MAKLLFFTYAKESSAIDKVAMLAVKVECPIIMPICPVAARPVEAAYEYFLDDWLLIIIVGLC